MHMHPGLSLVRITRSVMPARHDYKTRFPMVALLPGDELTFVNHHE